MTTAHGRARPGRAKTMVTPGLAVHLSYGWLGCRNARPPILRACTLHAGRLYRFLSQPDGCRGGPVFDFEPRAEALLQGLSPR